jgi:uncharacterized membrane protein YdbT with pleckstrin-like domain
MEAISNVRAFGAETRGGGKVVVSDRPDMRIVKVSLIATILPLIVSVVTYLLPLPIERDLKLALAVAIATIGLAGISFLLVMYEGLAKAVYTVTDEYVEEEYGIVYKRLRRIPLSYVRDVTYDQNFLQAIFGVSSITVSPTNGDKIVLSNIQSGESTRERIWKLVLSRSPKVQQDSVT